MRYTPFPEDDRRGSPTQRLLTVVAAVVRTDQLMEPHALHVGVLRKDILETVQVHIEALDRFGLSEGNAVSV